MTDMQRDTMVAGVKVPPLYFTFLDTVLMRPREHTTVLFLGFQGYILVSLASSL